MHCDYDLLAHKLQRWNNYITNYHLPEWVAIPDFGLYMDQVIVLLEGYLELYPHRLLPGRTARISRS